MSCVWCSGCRLLIDSDEDPECFTRDGDGPVLCEGCRGQDDGLSARLLPLVALYGTEGVRGALNEIERQFMAGEIELA